MSLDRVKFWINAFIPDPSMTEFVKPAPGASSGKSMILIPANVNGLPIPADRAFLGDNRGFSSAADASARIHGEVIIAGLAGESPFVEFVEVHCGESHEIDLDSGEIVAS